MPDIRDRIYAPHLRALSPGIYPRIAFSVRNQGEDSSCTGFSLAHVIDYLRFRETSADNPVRVSARMLYEMAKRNDEWAGSYYQGSSIRGAIKGFYRNGVCRESTAPDVPGLKDWTLTYEMAKEARETRLGAYLRVQPDISDYHAALNEVGVIYASAQIHLGWDKPENGSINPRGATAGGHAFAIVGYDDKGFWIRLSSGNANGGQGYDHLVIYAHGGLNSLVDEAKRIATWKRHDIYGRNKLYNFHLMWGSDFFDEVFGKLSESPVGRVAGRLSDWLFEAGVGKEIGSKAWRNMKRDALTAFDGHDDYDGGFRGLLPLLGSLDKAPRRPKLHLVGHSAGAIVLGRLLSALKRFKLTNLELNSIHLMAPACSVDFFSQHYGPYLKEDGALKLHDKIYLYNLTNELELIDTVSSDVPLLPFYSHSLLYLVSRAYEESSQTPLAGMQLYVEKMPKHSRLVIDYSKPAGGATASKTHGGFDNDPATLTTIMSRILESRVPKPPSAEELTGY